MAQGKSSIDREEQWKGNSDSVAYRPGKGIFLGLLAFSALIVLLLLFLSWYIPSVGLGNIHPLLPYVLGGLLAAVIVIVAGGVLVLTIAVIKGRDVFQSYRMRGPLIKFFLPLMIMVGGLFRIPKIRIEQSFIEINNQLVRSMGKRLKAERLLILLPHCIQFENCKIKVTQNVQNCVGCMKCEIGDLLALSEEFGIDLFVSTGGTIARKKVHEKRPHAIIAVACERDLTSGIQDAYPMPVLAIVNKRPQGYCIGTGVDMTDVREAVRELIG
ncbi:MAG: DUF116 domain-containing protein [Thermodesulfobacteriota bacterium]